MKGLRREELALGSKSGVFDLLWLLHDVRGGEEAIADDPGDGGSLEGGQVAVGEVAAGEGGGSAGPGEDGVVDGGIVGSIGGVDCLEGKEDTGEFLFGVGAVRRDLL